MEVAAHRIGPTPSEALRLGRAILPSRRGGRQALLPEAEIDHSSTTWDNKIEAARYNQRGNKLEWQQAWGMSENKFGINWQKLEGSMAAAAMRT